MTLADILRQKAQVPPLRERVPAPELAPECTEVWAQRMPGPDYLACDQAFTEHDGQQAVVLCVFAMVDAAGARLWTLEDLAVVAGLPGPFLDRFSRVAARINALRKMDREELVKNSAPAAAGDSSGTASPPTTAPTTGDSATSSTPSG